MSAKIYLASRSPRRRALLDQVGLGHEVIEVDVDESAHGELAPSARAEQLAVDKAQAGWRAAARTRELPVLAADTLIEFEGEVFGKPRDREAALDMLSRLAGHAHWVHTGVAVCAGQRCESTVNRTRVTMRSSSAAERLAYWNTGEPRDKAGGYAVQGLGAVFVEAIHGSYSGVVGLPLCDAVQLLARFGIELLHE